MGIINLDNIKGERVSDFRLECMTEAIQLDKIHGKMVSGPPEEIKHSTVDVPEKRNRIAALIQGAKEKYKTKYPLVMSMSKEVLDYYTKIDDLLKSNIALRKTKANNMMYGSYYGIYLLNTKKKKEYRFSYAQVFIPFDQVQRMIKDAMDYIESSGSDDYGPLERVLTDVDQYLKNNYWFVYDTTFVTEVKKDIKGTLEDHIITTKQNADNLYMMIYSETNLLSSLTLYENAVNKSYAEMDRLYRHDKKAIEIINKIFKMCTDYTVQAVEFNFKGMDYCTAILGEYAKQMQKFYDYIVK